MNNVIGKTNVYLPTGLKDEEIIDMYREREAEENERAERNAKMRVDILGPSWVTDRKDFIRGWADECVNSNYEPITNIQEIGEF